MSDIFDLIANIWEWLSSGIYEYTVEFMSFLVAALLKAYFASMYAMVNFSWDIAQDLLDDLQITQYINGMYSHFNNQILDVLLYFRLPEFTNTLVSAYVTKYVFSFLGGRGLF